MFAALCLDNEPRRALWGLHTGIFMPRRGEAANRTLLGGSYRLITAPQRGGRVGWREIRRLAGELSGNMVLPCGLTPPDYIGVFSPSRFESLLVANTAVELLRRSRIQIYRRVVGLVDLRGEYEDLALRMLPFCMSIKILTHRPRKYDEFAERVMELCGAPLSCGSDPGMFDDCVLVADPGGNLGEPAGLFKLTASGSAGEGVISHLCVDLPEGETCGGLDSHMLVAALYELSGSKEAGAMWASTARLSGRKVDFEELCREFTKEAGRIML